MRRTAKQVGVRKPLPASKNRTCPEKVNVRRTRPILGNSVNGSTTVKAPDAPPSETVSTQRGRRSRSSVGYKEITAVVHSLIRMNEALHSSQSIVRVMENDEALQRELRKFTANTRYLLQITKRVLVGAEWSRAQTPAQEQSHAKSA